MTELSGIIAVNKPKGWTSFDVIAKLRGVLHIKRLGHGGTLDPMAEGVLPVFVGKSTRCCDIMPDKRKRYTAGFRTGISTDTQDITGKILSESGIVPGYEDIERLLPEFIGDIMQTPPMYSAVKLNGRKLVDIARSGKTAERPKRQVTVNSLALLSYDSKTREGVLEIECLQGTYVRTIIDDIGTRLGCGAAMTSLLRTFSGGFELSDCLTIGQIEEACTNGVLQDILMPIDRIFENYPALQLDGHNAAMYKNGVKLSVWQVGADGDEIRRVYGEDGSFLGLAKPADGLLKAVKNFY